MEFDQVIVGEIPTDVDECRWCGMDIDHDCVEVKSENTFYYHVSCFQTRWWKYPKPTWTYTRYVLNADE